jgi:hypothetical protein
LCWFGASKQIFDADEQIGGIALGAIEASAAVQSVGCAVEGEELVVTGVAEELVCAGAGVEVIVAVVAVEGVVTTATEEGVVTGATEEEVGVRATEEEIVAFAAVEGDGDG